MPATARLAAAVATGGLELGGRAVVAAPDSRAAIRASALAILVALGSCFHGQALWGEPCARDRDCGPELSCQADGVCAEARMCSEIELVLADLKPEVALLLDHSLSMRRCLDDPDERDRCAGPEPPGPSRWDGLGALVRDLVPAFADRVRFAAVVFPTDTFIAEQGPCSLDDNTRIPFDAPDAAARILAAVPEDIFSQPTGENPVRRAWSDLFEPRGERPSPARAIVLITDNPPNCSAKPSVLTDIAEKLDAEVQPLVQASFEAGVLTVVVAISVDDVLAPHLVADSRIDGVNPHQYFSELALAGGAAEDGSVPYLHLADSAALPQVRAALHQRLTALTADFDRCRIHLDAVPDYPDLAAIELDGRLHRADPDCSEDQAWRYLDDSRQALELCPGACARLGAGAPVRIRLGCP